MSANGKQQAPWKRCSVCDNEVLFKSPTEFSGHLRECHCMKEGGSFVCKYGYNDVCSSLPVEGVSDQDYEDHVARNHIFQSTRDLTSKHVSRTNFTSPLYHKDDLKLMIDSQEWSVYSSTQNLPAVLNDPRRGKERDFFTKTWGDTFVDKSSIPQSSYLPEITNNSFEAYLKKTKRGRRSTRKSRSSRPSSDSSVGLSDPRKLKTQPPFDWSSQNDTDNIPKIFLQPNFSLENPDTFNAVFPFVQFGLTTSLLSSSSTANASHNSVRLINEKLSHYLDSVEGKIAWHVSLQSEAFFHAMTSHDALMEHLTSAVQRVKTLRERVHHIDDILVKGSLYIIKLKHKRQIYINIYKKLKLMTTLHQTQPTIHALLSTSDFVGALDLISSSKELLDEGLVGIQCFRYLDSHLLELRKVIESMMQTDFSSYIPSELNRPLTSRELVMDEKRLASIIMGMLRLKKHSFLNTYNDEASKTIKSLVKKLVNEAVARSNVEVPPGAISFYEQMRHLRFDDWLQLVNKVQDQLAKFLYRLQAVNAVIKDAIDIAAGKMPNQLSFTLNDIQSTELVHLQMTVDSDQITVSAEDHLKLSNALREMLISSCDFADDRTAKLFASKAKDGFFERLAVHEFVLMSSSVDKFVAECEVICGKRSTNLHLALHSQAHRLISVFHEDKKTKLNATIDGELWKQTEVHARYQRLVEYICALDSTPNCIAITYCDNEIESSNLKEFLLINGDKYSVNGTVLLLISMVVEYCECVASLPYLTSVLLMKLVELLKSFSSRTCQLILGAGALHLVGLKTITTKNLALASRCLQLMALIITKVKHYFERCLPAKQMTYLNHFDQALKDYNDHIQEIFNKLVTIMESMVEQQLSQWEVKPPVPSSCFRNICKQFGKFHKVISDVLPLDQVQKLFYRINVSFKERLKTRLQDIKVSNDGGPQHGLVISELAFYLESLQSRNCVLNEEDLKMNDIWVER